MSSFGKDSLVMLDIIERCGYKLPILFLKEPFLPKKYEFANDVILKKDYTVYDYPPTYMAIVKSKTGFGIGGVYQCGPKVTDTIFRALEIVQPKEGEPFLCGLKDLYEKPTGGINFIWDLIFIGHKSSDVDPVYGHIPLKQDFVESSPLVSLPLADFTDEDIWKYTEEFELPVNRKRYDPETNKNREDITYNPDYYYACTACIDKDREPQVFCPLVNKEIKNVSSKVLYLDHKLPAYVGEK